MRVIGTTFILTVMAFTASAQPAPSRPTCTVDVAQLGGSKNPELDAVVGELKRLSCKSGDHLVMTNIAQHQVTDTGQPPSTVNTYYSRFLCASSADTSMDHPQQSDGRNGLDCTYNGFGQEP